MTMDKNRFDELKLEDLEVKCSYCKETFLLKLENTIGGGYGVIGIRCIVCKRTFSISGGT